MSSEGTEQAALFFVWLIQLYNIWLSHLNCQHIRAIKAAQKQKCTVKAPHGAEQQELWDTRPPFLNQPFLWRPERGGEVLSESEETNIWKSVGGTWRDGWMDGWMHGQIYRRRADKGMWRGQKGAGADSSTSQSVRDWQSEANNGSIRCERQTLRGIFHSQWQPRSRSWLRGLNQPHSDNVALWNLIQPYSPIQSLVFLCPHSPQIITAWSESQQIKAHFTANFTRNELYSTGLRIQR